MNLSEELGLAKPFVNKAHEAILNIILTGTMLGKEGRNMFRPIGLTDTQFNVLVLLREQGADGRINQTTLGKMMFVNRSNITGVIDRMERDGLVARTPDPQDRRVNFIEITKVGIEKLEKAYKKYYARIDEVMSIFDAKIMENLSRTMETIRERIATQ